MRFPCVHAAATTPVQRLGVVFAHSPRHISLPRKGRRVGLHIVLFEACSAFTRVAACTLALSPIRDTLPEGFSHFVTSMTAPVASAGALAGWDSHPLESAALPRRTPTADSRSRWTPPPAPHRFSLPTRVWEKSVPMADDIEQWLDGLGLGQYAQAFAENDVRLDVLKDLSDADLKELGVSLGDRRRILRAITDSIEGSSVDPPTDTTSESLHSAEPERRQLSVMFLRSRRLHCSLVPA